MIEWINDWENELLILSRKCKIFFWKVEEILGMCICKGFVRIKEISLVFDVGRDLI